MTILWKKLLMIGLAAILSANIWAAEETEDIREAPAPALRPLPQFTLDEDIATGMRDYTEKAITFYKRLSGFSEKITWSDTILFLNETGNFLGDSLSLREHDHDCFVAYRTVPFLFSMESCIFLHRIVGPACDQLSMDFRLRDIFASIFLETGCADVYTHLSADYSELDDETFDPAHHYVPLRETIFIDALKNSPHLFDYFLYHIIDRELRAIYTKIKKIVIKYYEEFGDVSSRDDVAPCFPMEAQKKGFLEVFNSSLRKLFIDSITRSANKKERLMLLEEVVNSAEIDRYFRPEALKGNHWTKTLFASWPHPGKGDEE